MRKAPGHDLILYASIAMIVIAFLSIPALLVMIGYLDPNDVTRTNLETIMMFAGLAALPYQLLLLVGGICGIILCNTPTKFMVLKVFAIVLLILAGLLAAALLFYAPLMLPAIAALILDLQGIKKNAGEPDQLY